MKQSTRQAVHNKFGGHCAYCGEEILLKNMQVDHKVPRFRGGMDDLENLMPSCGVCNNWKRTWTIEEFRSEIEAQIARLRKYSAPFRLAEKYGLVTSNRNRVAFYFERNRT